MLGVTDAVRDISLDNNKVCFNMSVVLVFLIELNAESMKAKSISIPRAGVTMVAVSPHSKRVLRLNPLKQPW